MMLGARCFVKKKIPIAALLDRHPWDGFDELLAQAVGICPLGRDHENIILLDG